MNTSQYTIYTPSTAEIVNVAGSAKRRHPALASRIHKAQELLLFGSLQLDATAWDLRNVVRWRVASQSGNGIYVVVNHGCPCHDSRMNGAAYCKHSIAVHLLLKILNNRANVTIRNREIDLGILPDDTFNAYAPKMGHVHMCRWGTAYAFVDQASAIRYSIWLAAQPIAVTWPVAHSAAA